MIDPAVLMHLEASLPLELDEDVYRRQNRDLQRMNGEQLRAHWQNYGRREGRRANALDSRAAFLALLPSAETSCELTHPGGAPACGDAVQKVAADESKPAAGAFSAVISNHVLDRVPDLLTHLRDVEKLLVPRGMYFAVVADRRYTSDHFRPDSSIADVLGAHFDDRAAHTLRTRLEHASRGTHDDAERHWKGDHGKLEHEEQRIQEELRRHRLETAPSPTLRRWLFQPESLRELLQLLFALELCDLQVLRIYPTLTHSSEFWVVLKRRGGSQR